MNRAMAFAILISLAMVGGSFLVAGESHALTPQTGSVNVFISYGKPVNTVSSSSSLTFEIKDYSGVTVASGSAASSTISSLNYGNYYLVINPQHTVTAKYGPIITNRTVVPFTLGQSSLPLAVTVGVSTTTQNTITVDGLSTGNATLSLQTLSGFTFKTGTVNSTDNTMTAYVPNEYYANLTYNGESYANAETEATGGVTITLGTADQISGFVTSQSGSKISSVNAVIFTKSKNGANYTVQHFNSASYNILTASGNLASDYIFISSPGYNTSEILHPKAGATIPIILHKVNSSIYYNYSLSSNLHTLNLTATYDLGNYTTIPSYFSNSTVGSLYWQMKLDGITSPSQLTPFVKNLAAQYTSNMIKVDNQIYNMTGSPTPTVKTFTGNSLVANVTAEYQNTGVSSSLGSSGYSVSINALGTRYMPGSVYYKYNFAYNNPGLALTGSSSATSTFKSPIQVKPVSTTQTVTLTLGKVSNATVIDSEIGLYWTGITSHNYVLNSSSSKTVFIVPQSKLVHFNASNAYFNPVLNKNDYQNANFEWTVNGVTKSGYNQSFNFGTAAATTVYLNVTSPSGGTNQSKFTVMTSAAAPSISYSIVLKGKTLSSSSSTSTSPAFNISVPQSAVVTYSGYKSSLTVGGYSVPLNYVWYMHNFTSAVMNVTYAFDQPHIKVGTQYANLNVSTVFGTYANATFNVYVNDTTPPVAKMQLSNSTGNVSQPTAGVATVFSANLSYDPYGNTPLSYSWAVKYANGTTVRNGSTTYQVVGGALNQTYVLLKFNTLSSLIVSLKVTNHAGVSAYSNKTVSMIVDTPRLVVNSIYFKGNLTQDSKTTIYVNVSNNGTVAANDFSIQVLINSKVVATQTYNRGLGVGQAANVSFNYTPRTSGKTTLFFQANNTSEPGFMPQSGAYQTTLSIKAPAYKTPLIIGSIIGVIIIVGVVYYRLSSGGKAKKPKQQPKPKTELKKPQEKKQLEKKK